ncbi:hypothetical protein C8Q80DRAFT_674502 [Daedaleopsis nitida]|nr:hypothetical protein C8Q80DRAFT_674502 [Daedaleopsis nitida]
MHWTATKVCILRAGSAALPYGQAKRQARMLVYRAPSQALQSPHPNFFDDHHVETSSSATAQSTTYLTPHRQTSQLYPRMWRRASSSGSRARTTLVMTATAAQRVLVTCPTSMQSAGGRGSIRYQMLSPRRESVTPSTATSLCSTSSTTTKTPGSSRLKASQLTTYAQSATEDGDAGLSHRARPISYSEDPAREGRIVPRLAFVLPHDRPSLSKRGSLLGVQELCSPHPTFALSQCNVPLGGHHGLRSVRHYQSRRGQGCKWAVPLQLRRQLSKPLSPLTQDVGADVASECGSAYTASPGTVAFPRGLPEEETTDAADVEPRKPVSARLLLGANRGSDGAVPKDLPSPLTTCQRECLATNTGSQAPPWQGM